MKNLHALEPVGLDSTDAAQFIGVSHDLFSRFRAAGWIEPAVRGHRLVIYDVGDLRLLWNRIKRDGIPNKGNGRDASPGAEPPRLRKTKSKEWRYLDGLTLPSIDAALFLGMPLEVLEKCRDAGWIKCARDISSHEQYTVRRLRYLWERLKRVGLPQSESN